MKNTIIAFLAFAVTTLVATSAFAGHVSIDNPEVEPEVIVLKIHADWCPLCKGNTKPLNEAKEEFKGKPVLFLKLDITNKDTIKQSVLLAQAVGVEKVLMDNSNTGTIVVVDAESKKAVEVINGIMKTEVYVDAINKALE